METLGIDLGGTYARAAVVDGQGRILGSSKTALTDRTPEGVVAAICAAAKSALAAAPGTRVRHCGVGTAAQLDGDSGHVLVAPNLGWRDVPFGALLGKALGHSVRVVNDLSAAAWGEFAAGAARGARDVLTVFVGSGVGSALIANGQLLHGTRGVAGEFGHMKVVPGGRLCGCGEHGCLEAYAGGHNLAILMREALAEGRAPTLQKLVGQGVPTPVQLEQAALQGDAGAKAIYDQAAEYLSLCLANATTLLNPARLILGGGVLAHAPALRQRVERRALELTLAASRSVVEVRDAALGDDSGLIGAALLAGA